VYSIYQPDNEEMIVMDLESANETAAMWSENSMTAFTIYLTFTFAYLTVAYLAGKDLSRFQVTCVSTLYVAGAVVALLSCVNHLFYFEAVIRQNDALASTAPLPPGFWIYYIVPLLMLGIFVCLYFMWDIRHPKTE
jgi:hypothetical protein